MGLFDIGAKVVTSYKADTSDHKRKLRELRGEERKAAKERLDEMERQNSKLEKQIATIGKVAAAVGASIAAFKVGQAAYNEMIEKQRLVSAAGTASIESMQKASRGLIREMDLLKIAARANTGTFKLNQSQLDLVARATVVLTEKGFEQREVMEEVTKSLQEGSTEGLKKFGIVVKAETGTLEGLNATMGALSDISRQAGKDFPVAGESIQQSVVAIDDAMSELKVELGELVKNLAPAISGLSKLVALLAKTVEFFVSTESGDAFGMRRGFNDLMRRSRIIAGEEPGAIDLFSSSLAGGVKAYSDANASATASRARIEVERGTANAQAAIANAAITNVTAMVNAAVEASKKNAKGKAARIAASKDPFDKLGSLESESDNDALRAFQESLRPAEFDLGVLGQQQFGETKPFQFTGGSGSPQAPKRPSMIEQVFGPLSEMELYAQALQALNGAAVGAFDAWASGSMSAGEAFKKFIGDSIRAVASQMFIESIKHAALAIGAVAGGNFPGAAKHAQAAAAFGAGAVLAGTVARQFGAGSAPGVSGGAGGGAVARPAAAPIAAQAQGNSTTVFIGSDFGYGDRRADQERLRKVLKDGGMATGSGQVVFA